MKSFHFGRNLRHCRQVQEYSQEYMAQQMDVSQSTYSRWEQQARPMMEEEQMKKLAELLNVPIEHLKGANVEFTKMGIGGAIAKANTSEEEKTNRNFFSSFIAPQNWIQKAFLIGTILLASYACFEFFKGFVSAFK